MTSPRRVVQGGGGGGVFSPSRKSASGNNLLQELEALSHSLQPPIRRNNVQSSLAVSRRASSSAVGFRGRTNDEDSEDDGSLLEARRKGAFITPSRAKRHSIANPANAREDVASNVTSRRNRFTLSPFRGRKDDIRPPKSPLPSMRYVEEEEDDDAEISRKLEECAQRNKGFWSWKPFRSLSHIGMQRFTCIFSVYVDSVRGLSPSMSGIRLAVELRKKETKDGAVRTMPARVIQLCYFAQGMAEFEETLHIRCHVYESKSHGFQSRPFTITVFAVDVEEMEFGRHTLDLSVLLHKNIDGHEKEGWSASFELWGKARGGELYVGLGYEIFDKESSRSNNQRFASLSSRFKQRAPNREGRISRSLPASARGTPTDVYTIHSNSSHLLQLDNFDLNAEPVETDSASHSPKVSDDGKEAQDEVEEDDVEEFIVEEKGIEIHSPNKEDESKEEVVSKVNEEEDNERHEGERSSGGGEVVKEVIEVLKQRRMSDLENLARQIEELESSILQSSGKGNEEDITKEEETQKNEGGIEDLEIDKVEGDFLHMLGSDDEDEDRDFDLVSMVEEAEIEFNKSIESTVEPAKLIKTRASMASSITSSIIRSRDGGIVVQMSSPVSTGATLAVHISSPVVLSNEKEESVFELTQKLAAMGGMQLQKEISKILAMEDLQGKTIQQITVEGMANAIRKDKSFRDVSMASNIIEKEPVHADSVHIATVSILQGMAFEGLKIQTHVIDGESSYSLSSSKSPSDGIDLLSNAIPVADWIESWSSSSFENDATMLVGVCVYDPTRSFEALGWPMIGVVQCQKATQEHEEDDEEEGRVRVHGIHLCGLREEGSAKGKARTSWGEEKLWTSASKWMASNGLNPKGMAKGKHGAEMMWSLSSHPTYPHRYLRSPDVVTLKS